MRKATLLLIVLLLLCLFAACGTEEIPQAETPESFDISTLSFVKEKVLLCEAEDGIGAPFVLSKDLEITEYDGTVYAFESGVSIEERSRCIETTNALLSRIGAGKDIQIHIYTKQTYGTAFVDSGALYTCVQDWGTPEYTQLVLYALFGEYCNYGLIRGYAAFLCSELPPAEIALLEDGASLPDDLDIFNLNLLCFREEFVSDGQIAIADQIANTFVADYLTESTEESLHRLINDSGKLETGDRFTGSLRDFYASKNIFHEVSPLLFRLGGQGYAYIVKNPYCEMYIEQGWYDPVKDLCPYTYDGFLLMNLSDTMQFFTINTRQMEQYQQLFDFDDYNNDLRVFFTTKEHFHGVTTSEYDHGTHAVALLATSSFMHEFIHSLTFDRTIKENWAIEGSARHYSYYYDYYANAMNDVDFQNVMDQRKYLYLKEFQDHLGREIETDTDFAQINHLTAYAFEQDDPNDGGGYVPGASFIAYLISRFGEETVIKILFETHDFGDFTYEELVADWQAFIQKTNSSYTKSK